MKKKNLKNEATLEARISQILTTAFPTFRELNVVHQKYFSIKFGHHVVTVDLKESKKYPSKAILDILLTSNGENLILLELKREGQPISLEDVGQGISYARLIDQMPPITLVSNGIQNEFYDTYTKKRIDRTEVDFEFLEKITNNAFALAANDFKDAINLLLNNEPKLFSKVVNSISEERFGSQTGEIQDISKPINKEFVIERAVVNSVIEDFSKGIPLVGIIGSAFSGKTNFLYQFFTKTKSDRTFSLYLDCYDHNYSILQQLANRFAIFAGASVTPEKVREWIINALHSDGGWKFHLLLDNFNNDIPEKIKCEILELIELFNGKAHHILYTIDEHNYKRIAFVENREYLTTIGKKSKIRILDELNDKEYRATNNLLLNKFRIRIEHGGHYTPEYREPRIIRHLVSSLYGEDNEADTYSTILAVPDYDYLKQFSNNKTYPNSVHDLYHKIASCFFLESETRRENAELQIAASGSGIITVAIFKKHYPEDFDQLQKSATVVLREFSNGLKVIYPKVPELFAIQSITIIKEIIAKGSSNQNTSQICDQFLEAVVQVPYCDIVGAGILLQLGYSGDIDLFSKLIQKLMEIPPQIESIGKGSKILLYSEGVGHIKMNFEDDMDDGGLMTDFLPFAILSQMAGYPLRLEDTSIYSMFAFHLTLLYEVGSSEHFLRRADARSLKNMKSLRSYNWPGVGQFISAQEGIIEPFVQSIVKCFLQIPDQILILCERAFREENFQLLWRIYLALRTLTNITDEKLATQAREFVEQFDEYFPKFMAEMLTKDISDPGTRNRMKKKLLEFKGKGK